MELREFLETIDEGQIVAIGPKKGNSYCYIGEAGNVELIEKVYEDYRDKIGDRYTERKETLRSLLTQPVEMTGDVERDDKALYELGRTISKVCQSIDNAQNYLMFYKPILERDVVETYHKDVDDCLAILVDGTENAEFWFRSEFDKKYKK